MKDFMMYKKFTYENKSYKILEKKLQKEDVIYCSTNSNRGMIILLEDVELNGLYSY